MIPAKKSKVFLFGTIAVAISAALAVGCIGGGQEFSNDGGNVTVTDPNPTPDFTGTSLYCEDPTAIEYSALYGTDTVYTVDGPDSIPTYNVSRENENLGVPASEYRANAGNTIKRLPTVVPPAQGYDPETGLPVPIDIADEAWTGEDLIHPILVSYTEQVFCDPANLWGDQTCYELGDGSADIGDPNHIDDAFVSISLDNGKSWKKEQVGDTAGKTPSATVKWDIDGDGVVGEDETIAYPGHSHKMTMGINSVTVEIDDGAGGTTTAVESQILVAWLDKYCPAGRPNVAVPMDEDTGLPLEIILPDGTVSEDLFQVSGNQGSVDYALPCTVTDPEDLDYNCAPNGKPVYEVPFSCVWAARGIFDPETSLITWRQAEQITSGTRDANKIAIASAGGAGFAITWQEDPEGTRAGKGAGPGDGWSGATTNHGADIWYSFITQDAFDDIMIDEGDPDVIGDEIIQDDDDVDFDALEGKPKPGVYFAYPVRVTDNAPCNMASDGTVTDTKEYCQLVCTDSQVVQSNNNSATEISRCLTGDIDPLPQWDLDADGNVIGDDYTDMLEGQYAILDGDTGASRPAIKILKTMDDEGNLGEYITVLGYEETKGLSTSEPGEPEDPDAWVPESIAVQGKAVYFESFPWNNPVTVSAGEIVNLKVPPATVDDETGVLTYNDLASDDEWYFENARRLVIIGQVDPCEMYDETGTRISGSYPFGFMYKQSFETQGGASDMYIRMNNGFTYDTFEPTITNVSGQSIDEAADTDGNIGLEDIV
jgi:hypothetical protein